MLFRQLRERESGRTEKSEPRLDDGLYLGVENRSGESRVGTAYGVPVPRSERWCERMSAGNQTANGGARVPCEDSLALPGIPRLRAALSSTGWQSAIRWMPDPRSWSTVSQERQREG